MGVHMAKVVELEHTDLTSAEDLKAIGQCVTQITEKTLDGQGNVIDSKTTKITKAAPEEVIPATTTQPIESIQSDPTLITEKTIEKDASETKCTDVEPQTDPKDCSGTELPKSGNQCEASGKATGESSKAEEPAKEAAASKPETKTT